VNVRRMVTPATLIVLAAGVSVYATLADRGTVSDAERAGRRSNVFPSFRAEEVTRLQLVHRSETLVLERAADARGASRWTMTSPRHEPADPAAVDTLLRELELATRLRAVREKDAVGLEAPRIRGEVEVGPLQYQFVIGADAPRPEGSTYMRLEGEGTFVVDRLLKVQLMRDADAYRDRTLVPYGSSAMARLEVRVTSGESFAMDRHGGTFRVTSLALRASRAAVDRVMSAMAEGRAETSLDDATAERAMGTPAVTVEVTPSSAEHERVELLLGGQCPGRPDEVVVERATPQRVSACTARTLVDALTAVSVAGLVDSSLFFAHADEMEELRLEPVGRGEPRVEITRRGMGWRERHPEERDLTPEETDSANMLSLTLAQARGTDVRQADGPFEARTRVTVVRTGEGATEVVELAGPAADGVTWVRRLDDGAVLRLTREMARRLEPHPVALRARSVWPVVVDAASVVAIDDTCSPGKPHFDRRDHRWTMSTPSRLHTDAPFVVDLVETVTQAKAEAWIAERDDGTFGFDGSAACTVTLTREPGSIDAGARRTAIILGAAGDGGFYAHTSDDPAVFVASPGLRETLLRPVVDHQHAHVDAGDGTRN
jgi:hypothetical protein